MYLEKLVDPDQTDFILGRYIGENSRILYDLMNMTEDKNIQGLLLFIDFEKAFDTISWRFLHKVLQFFNFGPCIQKWITVLYSNIISAVNQGGHLSDFFEIQRGCRQEDPLSPYLFILCAEILAIKIRCNKNIKGLKSVNIENKLSQFADDTAIILDGSEISLKETMKELNYFGEISGLKINFAKTQVVWIGSMRFSHNVLCPELGLSWGKNNFSYLGIDFHSDLSKMIKMNYDKKVIEISALLKSWSKRNLTPIGRITVIKTLVIPKLIHLFSALPNPDDKYILNLNRLFFNFIWQKPIGNVKRETVVREYSEGGLKMIHLKTFLNSIKATWIRRLINIDKLKDIIKSFDINFDELTETGIDNIKISLKKCSNPFWVDVLNVWVEILNQDNNHHWEDYLKSPIWFNNDIKIDGKGIFYKEWFKKGVKIFNDLVDEAGELLSFQNFQNKFDIQTNFLKYYGITQCLKKNAEKYTKNQRNPLKIFYPYKPFNISIFLKNTKGSKDFYRVMLKEVSEPTNKGKVMQMFNFNDSDIKNVYKLPFVVTSNSQLLWFQYKINHLILTTNSFLTKIKILANPLCSFCGNHTETMFHLLWECEKVQLLLDNFENWLVANSVSPLNYNKKTFIFGIIHSRHSKVNNLILLKIKHYIYSCRCLSKTLSLQGLLRSLKNLYETEKYAALLAQNIGKFNEDWTKWSALFEM